MKTIIEPFRTKMTEPIRFTSRQEREGLLAKCSYNLFHLDAEDVTIDLLTDSGTSAMSSKQWAALMQADESYAGCSSYKRFSRTIKDIFGFEYVFPVHQGRAAERLLFEVLVWPGQVVPSNNHFDTTRGNLENEGAEAVDLPCPESFNLESRYPFKGNIDLVALEKLIGRYSKDIIPLGMITLTNNTIGGQPASLSNIAAYARLLSKHKIPFFIDAARFAENAWLMKSRDPGLKDRTIKSIVAEIFSYADGCLMSAKKDGLSNIGGFIALNNKQLAERIRESLILTEGFTTYGGLSGRDLETIAVGLEEALCEDYLHYREHSAGYLAKGLMNAGVPIVQPHGLHAVYIDAKRFMEHLPLDYYPGQSLVIELYREAGIRSCEIGSVMFGTDSPKIGEQNMLRLELVRLALPRRVYGQSHYDYVIEAVGNIFRRRKSVSGVRIIEKPDVLPHFTARFQPVTIDTIPAATTIVESNL
ncbi:MAG: tryptophanase [Candidatus Obscuribacterales bacterium]|nr:tryptophanase [Candidatus Obscuribacterales bacterium]